jgi:hypothetical protein
MKNKLSNSETISGLIELDQILSATIKGLEDGTENIGKATEIVKSINNMIEFTKVSLELIKMMSTDLDNELSFNENRFKPMENKIRKIEIMIKDSS